jgi:predicted hydrolase (HD superfamily)
MDADENFLAKKILTIMYRHSFVVLKHWTKEKNLFQHSLVKYSMVWFCRIIHQREEEFIDEISLFI